MLPILFTRFLSFGWLLELITHLRAHLSREFGRNAVGFIVVALDVSSDRALTTFLVEYREGERYVFALYLKVEQRKAAGSCPSSFLIASLTHSTFELKLEIELRAFFHLFSTCWHKIGVNPEIESRIHQS